MANVVMMGCLSRKASFAMTDPLLWGDLNAHGSRKCNAPLLTNRNSALQGMFVLRKKTSLFFRRPKENGTAVQVVQAVKDVCGNKHSRNMFQISMTYLEHIPILDIPTPYRVSYRKHKILPYFV